LELLTLVVAKISNNEDLWDRYFKLLVYASKTPARLLLDHEQLVRTVVYTLIYLFLYFLTPFFCHSQLIALLCPERNFPHPLLASNREKLLANERNGELKRLYNIYQLCRFSS
jgi:hypothetical protein